MGRAEFHPEGCAGAVNRRLAGEAGHTGLVVKVDMGGLVKADAVAVAVETEFCLFLQNRTIFQAVGLLI